MNERKLGYYGLSDIEIAIRKCQTYLKWRNKMIELQPGTVLEKEYKGNHIKVKVLKNGNLSYEGKEYDNRGKLMKSITKGKTAQFTTFFGLNKEDNGEDKAKKAKKVLTDVVDLESPDVSVASGSIDSMIRLIVRDEIKSFFRQ